MQIVSRFWQVWLEQEDKLYRCCLKLMSFNPTEAEDALGQARIKAWEKVQELGDSIRNLRAWLMQLTSNLCKDILKKDSRAPVAVENIELEGETGVLCTMSSLPSPQIALEEEERYVMIRRAVASLSQGMRDTFALHYYEGVEYIEIAEQQGLTYGSVCKRISRARQELKKKLRGYFRDEEKLESELELMGRKSPRRKAQVEKQSIGSDGKSSKKTITVSATGKCGRVVVEGKSSLKNDPGSQKALAGSARSEVRVKGFAQEHSPSSLEQVKERTIESVNPIGKETATLWGGRECGQVVVEEKPSLKNGAVEQRALVVSQIKEVRAKGSAQEHSPSRLEQVEERTIESVSPIGKETATVLGVRKYRQVVVEEKPSLKDGAVDHRALVVSQIKEVRAKGSAQEHSPSRLEQVEERTIESVFPIGKETATVSGARKCAAVGEKRRICPANVLVAICKPKNDGLIKFEKPVNQRFENLLAPQLKIDNSSSRQKKLSENPSWKRLIYGRRCQPRYWDSSAGQYHPMLPDMILLKIEVRQKIKDEEAFSYLL
ncbi:RNA polymerase sigma factor [Okeania sp. KiyG1]|uniref:RNA polymerase sigma factor n=1 Tax=Okeania sp. KiyG1 TaxID=2720165 RepID=UPI002107C60A|nr:sigma-70 family RNA polymerase sigma factor [Okeania sp. KiyG1]